MFNVISHRAEILLSLVFAVRADINQMSKVWHQYPFLGTQEDITFLIILAVPKNADFWTCSILISVPRLWIYFSNFVVIVPNAPAIIGMTTTFFIGHNLSIWSFNKLYFSNFFHSLSLTLLWVSYIHFLSKMTCWLPSMNWFKLIWTGSIWTGSTLYPSRELAGLKM